MRNKVQKSLTILSLFLIFPFFMMIALFFNASSSSDCSTGSKSSSSIVSSDGASSSDWTKDGSVANQTARKVFEYWVSKGLSGASASGIVGWVNSEGGFSMIGRAEGHYGTDLATNSIAYGVVPIGLSYYTTEAGGGIYQFTPYTKYAPLGDSKWENVDEMNQFVANLIIKGDWNASLDLTGGNHTFQQMAQMTNPQEATLVWQAYERGSVAHINQEQKKSDSQKAYDMFNGSNYKYDESKFKQSFGSSDSDSSSSSSSSSSSKKSSCKNHGGSGAWSEDGTGEVSYGEYSAWKLDDLPADLKQYAIDPRSLGMSYRESTGWNAIAYSGGQCTDLSASLMYALWSKNGQHPTQTRGAGYQVVGNWVSAFGGSTSEASAGAVFSQTPSSAGGENGHTGVVSHVFKNGDILVCEQNYSTLSGEDKRFGKYTWSYRYVTKNQLSNGYTFYSPSQSGYSIVSEAKAIG